MTHSPGFQALCEDARRQITEISPEETLTALQAGTTLVIDVREDREAAQGIIQGATHLGRGVLERDIEVAVPDKSRPIILYCGGGYRSTLAALNLQKMGYTQVKSMAGGWRAWNACNYPISAG
ncbi:MAG: rhodanese-like domain-containing protein [Candidatus Methylacidiphilales bacterium]|nr:rhodanese-like domain-containing protein [Candidatus Methylacidiphilales bacterium]